MDERRETQPAASTTSGGPVRAGEAPPADTENPEKAPRPQRDQVYTFIRQRIIEGEYGEGDRLREGPLADTLEVSRTPVREALHRLATEGLVEMVPNRGARVAQYTRQEVRDIYEIRVELEGYAARRAAQRVGDEGIEALKENLSWMQRILSTGSVGDKSRTRKLMKANNAFHHHIRRFAANDRLDLILNRVIQLPLIFRALMSYSEDDLQTSWQHHRALVFALADRDPTRAETIMRSHSYHGLRIVDEMMADG